MTDYVHLHIIRINYPKPTDVRYTDCMINHIKSVIKRETGIEAEIEVYLL